MSWKIFLVQSMKCRWDCVVLQWYLEDVIFTAGSYPTPFKRGKTKNNKHALCKRQRRSTIQTSDDLAYNRQLPKPCKSWASKCSIRIHHEKSNNIATGYLNFQEIVSFSLNDILCIHFNVFIKSLLTRVSLQPWTIVAKHGWTNLRLIITQVDG